MNARDTHTFYCYFFVVILAAMLCGAKAECAKETLIIDLAEEKGPATFRASGFLHSISVSGPPQELVEPLKPRLFRATAHSVGLGDSPGIYERVTALGARIHLDLSSSYGCAANGPCPGDDDDWTGWDNVLDWLLIARKQKGYRVQWDIWNEPNLSEYWSRSYERYLELWRRTVKKIRCADPRADIVGPSISGYDREWLQRFLLWAKHNDVLPDVISWHEFTSPRNIPTQVSELREFLSANGIAVNRISLNEIVGPHHLTKPGPTALYLWAVEEADVESAARACWEDEENGVSGCWADSLDGILTPRTFKPRSTWWVYRRYADVSGRLVRVHPGKSVCGIAAIDNARKQIALLFGCDGQGKTNVRIQFTNIRRIGFLNDKLRVVVERIPDSGWKHLPRPEVILDCVRTPFAGKLTVVVPDLGAHDACFVRISSSRAFADNQEQANLRGGR